MPLPDGQNPDGTPAGEGQAAPGQSTVPYTDVYGSYAQVAGAALDSDYIPLGYKSYIRDYFASLDPGR